MASDKSKKTFSVNNLILDLFISTISGIIVAVAYYSFINANDFAPGGLSGISAMIGYLTNINLGYFTMLLNLPILIISFFKINKRSSIFLIYYIILQSVLMIIFEKINFFEYIESQQLILPAIAGGVISGVGYALMFKRFGISAGTFAISVLIKRKYPNSNVAWIAFVQDVTVVVVSLFVYTENSVAITPALCTLINLFIASEVLDFILRGLKTGYKVEIVTDSPEEVSQDLIRALNRSVTLIPAKGMYTHSDKNLLICLIRKREINEFIKVLKKYPNTFSYISQVNEVFGNFQGYVVNDN